MGFWIRNLIFGVILAAAAYILLANQELLVDIIELFESDEKEVAETIVVSESTSSEDVTGLASTPAPKKIVKNSGNAAAEGLSRFYASINPSFNEKGPRIRENIVYLPDPKGNLSEILEARKKSLAHYVKIGEVTAKQGLLESVKPCIKNYPNTAKSKVSK